MDLEHLVNPAIAYTTQLKRKVELEQLTKAAQPLLMDVAGFRDFAGTAKALYEERKLKRSSDFEQWKETVADSKHEMGLDMRGKLMSFDKANGLLRVRSSERLVTRIHACRQLCAHGLITRDVAAIVSTAHKYSRSATVLRLTQVAAV